MPNPKGYQDSIKNSQFKAAWQSGPTRTIRVPIALANATLEYAHQLDQVIEPGDTVNNPLGSDRPSPHLSGKADGVTNMAMSLILSSF